MLLSADTSSDDAVPAGVVVPEGMGAEVIAASRPASASYELFAPSVNYHTVDVDRPVDSYRTYLIGSTSPTTAVQWCQVPRHR